MELMGPQKRVLWSAFTHSVYAVGEAVLGGVAWALQDWRWILRAFYGPAVLSLAVLWSVLPTNLKIFKYLSEHCGCAGVTGPQCIVPCEVGGQSHRRTCTPEI